MAVFEVQPIDIFPDSHLKPRCAQLLSEFINMLEQIPIEEVTPKQLNAVIAIYRAIMPSFQEIEKTTMREDDEGNVSFERTIARLVEEGYKRPEKTV